MAGIAHKTVGAVMTQAEFEAADSHDLSGVVASDMTAFAASANGVTNGDSHDHAGGDGGQVDHGGLAGLSDDDHTQYIKHSLATATSDFLAASGAGAFVKKTLAETKTILGIADGTANYLLGMNAAANAKEWKSIVGTSNRVTVTHGANLITLNGPQDLHTGASPTFVKVTMQLDAGSAITAEASADTPWGSTVPALIGKTQRGILLKDRVSEAGGLWLNGRLSDAGFGCGLVSDMGSFRATRTTAGWFCIVSGVLTYYANTGLTVDTDISATARFAISTAGVVRMHNYGAGSTSFDASGNLASSSDERLKDIQGSFTPGLASILQINPIRFKWKKETGLDTDNVYAGFSAQNVMKYIPQAVGKNTDGYYSLSDRTIIATLVNAIKELSDEVAILRARVVLPVKPYPISADNTEDNVIKVSVVSPVDVGPVIINEEPV